MTDSINTPDWRSIHTLVFDFDGIFTDNKVIVDQFGKESVICDRADGLAFDMLRKFATLKNWPINCIILSKEANPVVLQRAKKLKIKCIHGIDDKLMYLRTHLFNAFPESPDPFKGVIYFGNDLNDLSSILLCGFSIVPCDAHPLIQKHADIVLPIKGGNGFVRSAIERILRVDRMDTNSLARVFNF